MMNVRLRSPSDVLAIVPYLLGFHPADSVVVLALRGTAIVFQARGDLPFEAGARGGLAEHIAAVVARQRADAAVIVGYGPPDRVTPAVASVTDRLAARGVAVREALRATDGRYWSYLCHEPECCPATGVPYDVSRSPIAATATVAGRVALPDREALVNRLDPVAGVARESMRQATERADKRLGGLIDHAVSAAARDAGSGRGRPIDAASEGVTTGVAAPDDVAAGRAVLRVGQEAVAEAVSRRRCGGQLTDDEVAWLSVLLVYLPVRDHAWDLVTPRDARLHESIWLDVTRRAEPDLVAAPATLLGYACWRAGDGVTAGVAVERALAADPTYAMAQLLRQALASGVPPSIMDIPPARPAATERRRQSHARRIRRQATRSDRV